MLHRPTTFLLHTLLIFGIMFSAMSNAASQTGVSGDRVSLPEGAGSLEGVGENVSVNPNMGLMSYDIPIDLPGGYDGMTPPVGLSYSSGAGVSMVGMGWSMGFPSIERMTNLGLPEYESEDAFVFNGGEELIRISDGEPAVYRARFEGGFALYKWHERGEGQGGYWTVEFPDGRIGWFGASAEGEAVSTARVSGDQGVFRYHLVEMEDVWGHKIRYEYDRFSTSVLPTHVYWVFHNGEPRYELEFSYEDRPDFVSDCKPGFCEVLEHRLSSLRILNRGVQQWRYALEYEEGTGISRLASVARYGARDGLFPAIFSFSYSESLGGVCQGNECDGPYLVDMGNINVTPQNQNFTLVDLNGDALPDILDTTGEGAHTIFLNQFRSSRDHGFEEGAQSSIGTGASHALAGGRVQVLDVDGDGFADLLNTIQGRVLENLGAGDWTRSYDLFENTGGLPNFESDFDPEDGDLSSIRFLDVDNDKRIDVIRSQGAGESNVTGIFMNRGSSGFVALEGIDPLEMGFESDRTQLADMNGDGLLDIVYLSAGALGYQLNLGWGQWGSRQNITGLPFDETEIERVELEDLNNDALADLVLVKAREVLYALNRNGTEFEAEVSLTDDEADFSLPVRDDATTILFADMNGSGSSDVVWISSNGQVQYLELFPVQPNLLKEVSNGLGMTQTVTYSTHVEEAAQARDAGNPWEMQPSYPNIVVKSLEVRDAFTGVTATTHYNYYNGFYDGEEKAFRGFGMVEVETPADGTREKGLQKLQYDLGMVSPHRAGLLLTQELSGEDTDFRIVENVYDFCDLDGLPAEDLLSKPIRFVCLTEAITTGKEGTLESAWVTTRSENTYDGYGNVTSTTQHGIETIGGQGCEPCSESAEVFGKPCGNQCLGDESFRETTFVSPENTGGKWILGLPSSIKVMGREGSNVFTEAKIFYDGADFEGLPEGQLTHGAVTRSIQRSTTNGDWIPKTRVARDEHGNSVVQLSALGSPEDEDSGRQLITFDETGRFPVRTETLLVDELGEPYRLREDITYDALWEKSESVTNGQLVRDGQVVSVLLTRYTSYNQFGQPTELYAPGDPEGKPGEVYEYKYDEPSTPTFVKVRSEKGGDLDLATVRCLDGFGRVYQERVQVSEGVWAVSGFQVFNPDGSMRRLYAKYTGNSEACEPSEPSGVPYLETWYDGLGRISNTVRFNAEGQEVGRTRVERAPTYTLNYDEEDTNPDSPHFDTPTRRDFNGQDRTTSITRMLSAAETITHTFTYDELGRFRSWKDPQGNEKIQHRDLVGRITRIEDPDRGEVTNEHNAMGSVVRSTDARGVTVRYDFDSVGRPTSRWTEGDEENTLVRYFYDFARECELTKCMLTTGELVEIDFPDEAGERGRIHYGFDLNGNATYTDYQVRGKSFETSLTFNNAGALTQAVYPGGQELNIDYDKALRVQSISGFVDNVSFNPLSLADSIELANGTTETFTFDDHQRVSSKMTRKGSTTLAGHTYTYDNAGNILAIEDAAPLQDGVASRNAEMTYDALYRLTSAQVDAGRDGLEEVLSYAYDDLDKITSKTSSLGEASSAHVGDYVYAGAQPHAVTAAGGKTFDYNAAGQMTKHGEFSLERDASGRIVRVTRGEEEISRTIFGPGSDRLFQETPESTTWHVGDGFEIRDGVASVQVRVGGIALGRWESMTLATTVLPDHIEDEEINAADAWANYQVQSGSMDTGKEAGKTMEILSASVSRLLMNENGEQKTFVHTDRGGSVIATSDENGEVLSNNAYLPFGALRSGKSEGGRDLHSKPRDQETGFVDYGQRAYDPVLGRWLSPDPMFLVQNDAEVSGPAESFGAYVFVNNNPVGSRDVGGQFVEAIEGGIALIMAVGGSVLGGVTGAWSTRKDRIRDVAMLEARYPGVREQAASMTLGGIKGAIGGFFNPGTSAGLALSNQGLADGLVRVLTRGKLTNQQVVTTTRVMKAIASFALGLGVTAIATVLTGGAFPVLALVSAGVILGIKAIIAGTAHFNGFTRLGLWASRKFSRLSKHREGLENRLSKVESVGKLRVDLSQRNRLHGNATSNSQSQHEKRDPTQFSESATSAGGSAYGNISGVNNRRRSSTRRPSASK